MDVTMWVEMQELAVYVFAIPLLNLAAWAVGCVMLLAIAEMLAFAAYRVLARLGVLD
jgi:hypothetical protein